MSNDNPLRPRRTRPDVPKEAANPTLGKVYETHNSQNKTAKQKITVEISEEAYMRLLMLKGKHRTPMGALVTDAVMRTYGESE
ncbi:hypothetical protein AB0Y14_12330 [Rothia sp. HC945]|uniref:hypothetical protein n=1 Tax=Rothia sp. HC945 TaxID=3171170 RepID=UPI003F224FF1